ncbi:class I SAM-dependent methyltransferase [Methylomagnum sp.]
MNQLLSHTSGMGQAEMFSNEWYDEYFHRAYTSPTHARYCEQVYGRDLCQHGMMDTAEMAFLASLLRPGEKVLEIGCSNGRITEYLQQASGCRVHGLDYSDVAIGQARERIQGKNVPLEFSCVDLIHDEIPGGNYDTILSIDTIYFMGDYLLPEHTRLGEVLNTLGFSYIYHDFTANVRNHWLKNYHLALALQPEFTAEGNELLFTARMAENGWFKDHGDAGTLVRYMYVIERKAGI